MATLPSRRRIVRIWLNRHQPAVSFGDLAQMLEIDLFLGHRGDFRRRLHRALEDARRQGTTQIRQLRNY